jgi:hypothetical protein
LERKHDVSCIIKYYPCDFQYLKDENHPQNHKKKISVGQMWPAGLSLPIPASE